jgi:hypothetical protein
MLKKMNNTKFFKIGDNIVFNKNTEGLEYDLEPGKVYNIIVDKYNDDITLKVSSAGLQLPEKIYSTEHEI